MTLTTLRLTCRVYPWKVHHGLTSRHNPCQWPAVPAGARGLQSYTEHTSDFHDSSPRHHYCCRTLPSEKGMSSVTPEMRPPPTGVDMD